MRRSIPARMALQNITSICSQSHQPSIYASPRPNVPWDKIRPNRRLSCTTISQGRNVPFSSPSFSFLSCADSFTVPSADSSALRSSDETTRISAAAHHSRNLSSSAPRTLFRTLRRTSSSLFDKPVMAYLLCHDLYNSGVLDAMIVNIPFFRPVTQQHIRLQMAFSTAFPVTCQRMMATALRQRFIFSHRQGRAFITCPNVLSVTRVSPSAFVVLFEGCDNLIVRSECGHHFSGYLRRTPTGAPA